MTNLTGLYRGIVINTQDPRGLRRIQAQVPQLLGAGVSGWAMPVPPTSTAIPRVGDQVMVSFEGGDLSHPIYFAGDDKKAVAEQSEAIKQLADAQGKIVTDVNQAQTLATNAQDAASQAQSKASEATQQASNAFNQAVTAWDKALASAQAGGSLVLNGSFEQVDANGQPVEWTALSPERKYVASSARSGSLGLQLTPSTTSSSSSFSNQFRVAEGRTYYIEAWAKADAAVTGATAEISFRREFANGSVSYEWVVGGKRAQSADALGWVRISGTTTAPEGAVKGSVVLLASKSTSPIVWSMDDVLCVDVTEAVAAQKAAEEAAQKVADTRANAVFSSLVEYAVGSSDTAPPTVGWSTSTPTRKSGTFVWMRTQITYGDGRQSTTSPVLVTGPAGADGTSVTIKGRVPTAAQLPTTAAEGDGWITEDTGHLWVRTGTTWTDAGLVRGPQGNTGDTGVSVTAVVPYWASLLKTAAATAPKVKAPGAPWTTTEPAWTPDTSLWRAERIDFSDGTFQWTTPVKVASYEASTQAINSANGKNTVTRSLNPPGTTKGSTPGDVWWQVDGMSSGNVIGQWMWDGSIWQMLLIKSEVIASLDVAKLTAGTASIDLAVAQRLVADFASFRLLTADKLVISTPNNLIPNGSFEHGTRNWHSSLTFQTADVPPGERMAATSASGSAALNPIISGEFAVEPGAEYLFTCWIKADKPGSISFLELRDALTGAHAGRSWKIDTGEYEGNYLFGNDVVPTVWTKVTCRWVANSGVTVVRMGSWYVNHSAGTERTAAVSIAGLRLQKRSGGELIIDGAITAVKVATKSITTDKLLVQAGPNLIPDPQMLSPVAWRDDSRITANAGKNPGSSALVFPATSTAMQTGVYATYGANYVAQVVPGMSYRVSMWVKSSVPLGASNSVAIYGRTGNATQGDTTNIWTSPLYIPNSAPIPANTWTEISGTVAIPADMPWLMVGLYRQPKAPASAVVTISDPSVIQMTGSELVVNGAVTTDKLAAKSVNAEKVVMDEAFATSLSAMIANFQSAFIGKLNAQMIEAGSFRGYRIEGAEFVSPSTTGDITIKDNKMVVNRAVQEIEGGPTTLQETLRIGGADGDQIALTPAGVADPTVVIDGADGTANFGGMTTVGDLTVGGKTLSELLDPLPRGLIGWTWGSGEALPDIGQSAYGLVKFQFEIESGRRYRFSADLKVQGTPGDVIEFNLHYRAAADDVNLSTPIISQWRYQIPTGGMGSVHLSRPFSESYSHSNYGLLLSMRNWSTTTRPVRLWQDAGSNQSQSFFWLEDLGMARANTAASEWTSAGGSQWTPPAAPPPPPPPPPAPTKRTYTRTYTAVGAWAWNGPTQVWDVLHHGYLEGRRRYSQILFPSQVRTDTSGATIKSARIRLRNVQTYYASATVSMNPSTHASGQSAPVTSGMPAATKSSWKRGETKYVALNGWTPSMQSVWLGVGAGSTGAEYAKFSRALSDIVLEVTYEK